MASINTLLADVSALLQTNGWFTQSLADEFAKEVSLRMQTHFNEEKTPRLRMSKLGDECPCALWNSIHHPELAEPLPSHARFKYAYGHIIEALAICLAKASGHTVTGEQDEVVLDGIVGHRDCVIDGCIVDVKSCSSYSFQKFKDRTLAQDDAFGYLEQMDAYVVGSSDDPLVQVKDRGYFWAIDKVLGKMCLYEHYARPTHIRNRITEHKRLIGLPSTPACTCGIISDGKSGNLRLDVKASYNSYKYACFPRLRTFLYAEGPRYLTKVVKLPRRQDGTPIPEVDRNGDFIYH